MADLPPPLQDGSWPGNLVELLKYVLAPFGAVGTWAGIKWLMQYFGERGTAEEKRAARQVSDREKMISSLDTRQAAHMDRIERSEVRMSNELEVMRATSRKEVASLQLERDVIYFICYEQEDEMVNRRDAHVLSVGNYNGLLDLFKHLADGSIVVELVEEVRTREHENDPTRPGDIRVRIRNKLAEARKSEAIP